MATQLSVGMCRKIGLPEYSSVGAEASITTELDSTLLGNPRALAIRIAELQATVAAAVELELKRLQGTPAAPIVLNSPRFNGNGIRLNGNGHANGNGKTHGDLQPSAGDVAVVDRAVDCQRETRPSSGRLASPAQLSLIRQLAKRERVALSLIQDDYSVSSLDELTSKQASEIIDRFKKGS